MTTPEDGSGREPMAVINEMKADEFVARFGKVCGCDWIARRLAAQRPFTSVQAMLGAMTSAFHGAPEDDQYTLLRSVPDMHDRHFRDADLDRQYAAYQTRFGYPFILSIEGTCARAAVKAALALRLQASDEAERETALAEVVKLARLKLERVIGDGPGGVDAE